MKQLKQSQFIKNGVEHENISSPETSTISTRVISISVDKYGKFQYTTDGINYIELDPQTSEITSVDTIYDDVSELPEGQQYGTILPAYTNTALPVILYEYTEDDGWVEKQQVNEYSIYYVTEKGTLYIFIGTEFVSTTPEQTIKIISPSSNVLTTEEYNTLVANNCVLGTSISGLDWAEAGTILTKPFEYNGSLRGMYIRNSKIGTYLITISTKTIGNGATDIVLNQVAQLNGKAVPTYPANSGTFNLQIVNGTITWSADNSGNFVTLATNQEITGTKTILDTNISFKNSNASGSASWQAEEDIYGQLTLSRTYNNVKNKMVEFNGNSIKPVGNNGNLGSSSQKWSSVFADNITDGTNSIAINDIASKTNVAANYVSVNAQELTSTQQEQVRTNIDAQEIIDTNNMLSADLVDDTNTTHKFTTSSELSQIATNTNDITNINDKIPNEASSSNQLADKAFVNSSINAFAAYYITRNASGDPFETKAQLDATSTYYSGGSIRIPTNNDYCIVVADETKGTEVSGYASFTTTSQYVGYYVIYNYESVMVTDANKDSVGITAGTTIAYETLPITRYSYQGNQWEYQYTLNNTSFTQAQLDALNSGITRSEREDLLHKSGAETITGVKTFKAVPVAKQIQLVNNVDSPTGNSMYILNDNGYNGKIRFGNRGLMFTSNGTTISPDQNSGSDLGSSNYKWKDLYLSGKLSDGNNANYGVALPDTTNYTADKTIATTDQIPDISTKMDKADPTGTGSFSLNRKENTTIGLRSVAVGYNTTASANNSFAQGNGTTASFANAHAEGQSSVASGSAAHAEGFSTDATGWYSHAEGNQSTASGGAAHAEGEYTTASGDAAHAEGRNTTASGSYSHAEGYYTTSQRKSQHVFGEYNVLDNGGSGEGTRGTYVEIVGNGTANSSRSNARTLDWSGNEELAGNIDVKGGKIGDGKNANYKLAIPDTTSWTADKTIATTDQIPDASTMVTINTTQTISGEKTFTGNIKNTGIYYIGSGNVILASMSGSNLTLGNSSSVLKLAGSGTRPTYNGNSLALQSDVPSAITITTTTGSESISDGTNTLNVVTRDTAQTITGHKTFSNANGTDFSYDIYIDGKINDYDSFPIVDPHYSAVADWLLAGNKVAFGNGNLDVNSKAVLIAEAVQMVGSSSVSIVGSQNRPQYYKIGGGTYSTHDFAFLDDLYPVGAVYISTSTTSPASLFGGTWSGISAGYALWTTWTSSGDAGGTISAGLPNIKGSLTNIGSNANDASASGAFTKSSGSNSYGNTNSGNKKTNIDFNAHNYNTIYSDSVTTVQPPAYKVYAWRRTA